jgi:drug/metabolite transporter (DMT)-like permease
MIKNKYFPYISLYSAIFIWSVSGLLIRLINYPATYIVLFSGVVSLVALLIYVVVTKNIKNLFSINFDILNITYMLLSGIFAILISYAFADKNFSIGAVSLIVNAVPFLVIILAPIFLKENSTKIEYILAFITFIGLVIFIYGQEFYGKTNGLNINLLSLGLLFSIMALVLNAILTLLNRNISQKSNNITIPFFTSIGNIVIGIIAVFLIDIDYSGGFAISSIIYNIIHGFFIVLVGFMLITYSFKHLKSQLITITNLIQPIITAIIGYIILSEDINELMALGGLIVIISSITIILVSNKKK